MMNLISKIFKFPATFTMVVLLTTFVFGACSSADYEKHFDLPETGWNQDSTYTFKFEVTDPEALYEVNYHIRNNLDYPFHNLYMQFFLEDEKNKKISSEIQEVQLLEKRTGRPYGKGFSGIYQNKIRAFTYTFPKAGTYYFKVKQYMREPDLEGIVSVGVSLEKVNKQESGS